MRILYIGPFDRTGYGHASIAYCLAMDVAGINVIPRILRFNDIPYELPKRIVQLMNRSQEGCDHVITHFLPHVYEYDGHYRKNIGAFCCETSHFRNSNWPERCNLLDNIWVPSLHNRAACRNSQITQQIDVIPYPVDKDRFFKSIKKFEQMENGKFKFYTIGEINQRKNIAALLKAFHLEFSPDENVELVIKATPTGNEQETLNLVGDITNKVKEGLKLYNKLESYHKETVIANNLTDEQVDQLHKTCDCFVSTSFGESWCIPAHDAMLFGKIPIVPASTGFLDYMGNQFGWLVAVSEVPVFGMVNTFNDLYCANENWYEVNIFQLRKAMREAFENKELRMQKAAAGMEQVENYCYETVGQQIKKVLERQ